ncbi:MAG: hypothetical protein LBR79_07275 [Oscillospiraceae bacterium]|nr:hypothetical protein [Oscillospiraceae bacterium]
MNKNELFEKIAKEILGIDTLATQMRDSLDFHEVSVANIKMALDAAYKAGQGEEMLIGKIVKNNGKDLAKFLNGTDLKHVGNFIFTLNIDGKKHKIITEPVDEDYEKIKILNIIEN